MKETIAFTIGLLAVIGFGVFLVRRKVKKEYVSDEQLQRTFERALASANADSERRKNDEILDYNSLLKEFALKGRIEMRDIMQNVYD